MAKGLKMGAARKKDSGAEIFKINELSTSDNGNLRCEFCKAEVQYVSAYVKGASKTPVAAYLRLWQDNNHVEGCAHSIDGAIEKLVAESDAIEDNSRILKPGQARNHVFRMNILVQALGRARESSKTAGQHNNSGGGITGINYVPSGEQLTPYFRTAAGLARIRALILESSDVELFTQLVKIQYKGCNLNWNDFYYEQPRYPVLYRRLNSGEIHHPVALKLTLKSDVIKSNTAKRFPWSFQCYGESTSDMSNGQVIIPRIRFAKKDFPEILCPGNTVLVVGKAWADRSMDTNSTFKNFSIAVYHNSQIREELDMQ